MLRADFLFGRKTNAGGQYDPKQGIAFSFDWDKTQEEAIKGAEAHSMLNEWILQRAATGRTAIPGTDQTAWANASKLINLSPQLRARPDPVSSSGTLRICRIGP